VKKRRETGGQFGGSRLGKLDSQEQGARRVVLNRLPFHRPKFGFSRKLPGGKVFPLQVEQPEGLDDFAAAQNGSKLVPAKVSGVKLKAHGSHGGFPSRRAA